MKRIILVFWVGLFSLALFAQDIPNPGFENWTDAQLFDEPEGYSTTNPFTFFFSGGPHITRVDGRVRGTSALRMEVDESVVIGLPPLVYNVNLNNPLAGGAPFAGRPDSMVGYFNYDLSPNDTFSLFAILKVQGIPLSFIELDLSGSSNGFERISLPTGPFIFPPDSVAIVMGIGALSGTPILGDFVEIDELTFINSTEQLPNNSFENWETISYQDPDEWASTNLFAVLSGTNTVSVERTDDAHSGNYAARIESVEYDFFGTKDTSGFLISGDFLNAEEGFPYNQRPGSLSFYYKFEPKGAQNEKAFVNIVFTKAGEELSNTLMELPPVSQYTGTTVILDSWTGTELPDTCFIGFAAGEIDTLDGPSVLGSVLYVDDLVFGPGVSVDNREPVEISNLAFPNPASDLLYLDASIVDLSVERIEVVSMNGQQLRSIQNSVSAIPVGDLVPGWYVLRAFTAEKIYLMKFEKI